MSQDYLFPDAKSDSEVSIIGSSDSDDSSDSGSFEMISDFDVQELQDLRETPEDVSYQNNGEGLNEVSCNHLIITLISLSVIFITKFQDGTIEICTPRYSAEQKAAISGEWKLVVRDSGEDDSEEFLNTTRCLRFRGDTLITYQKYLGVETYSLGDERQYIRNGKLHVIENGGNVRIYERLTYADDLIDNAINGTWKVVSINNFKKFKKFRNLGSDQEFLWLHGHAFYQLEDYKFTRGTIVNGIRKDFLTVELNDFIHDASTTKRTYLSADKLITVSRWKASGLEKWRIERYFKEGKLYVSHIYPEGIVSTRVLEKI